MVGWRGAFLGASVLGVAAAFVLAIQGDSPVVRRSAPNPRPDDKAQPSGLKLLLSPPILLNLILFLMLSMVGGGLNQYLVVGLEALHGTPPVVANTALTGLLAMSAIGVLLGGPLAGRDSRHQLATAVRLSLPRVGARVIGSDCPGAL